MEVIIKNGFEGKEHLIDKLDPEFKDKINMDKDDINDDDILGIAEAYRDNELLLFVKMKLFYNEVSEEDDLDDELLINGKFYYCIINGHAVNITSATCFMFDDYHDKEPKTVWLSKRFIKAWSKCIKRKFVRR